MQQTTAEPTLSHRSSPWLKRCFCAMVLALAVFQFSENTADPDLWAHAMFGEQILLTGRLQRAEPYSWTAPGSRWINHEWLSEAAIGAAHLAGGGAGILLLKVLVGLATFGIALRLGGEDLDWPWRALAWGAGAIAVIEISYGFAARPQIFTALFLAIELWLLRRISRGKLLWAFALPPLFVLWINAHGGVLAGGAMLFVAAVTMTGQTLWYRSRRPKTAEVLGMRLGALDNFRAGPGRDAPETGRRDAFPAAMSTDSFNRTQVLAVPPVQSIIVIWLAGVACAASLLINPYGLELVRWIISEVFDLSRRPELQEWSPARLGWDHAALFILLALAAISFAFSRRRRALWEAAICATLAFFAIRSVRHAPLFAIAALAFIPPHLADVIARLRPRLSEGAQALFRPQMQAVLGASCGLVSVAILVATFTLHKDHPFTMEVPRQQYPVAAVQFMRRHRLAGKLLVFFDWGEMCLWELPDCTVSIDGRWDTCYPRQLIVEHWHFYNDQPVDKKVLDIGKADIALLPENLAGAVSLWRKSGWTPLYHDDLAVILVRDLKRYPQFVGSKLPIAGPPDATLGRAPFPSSPAPRVGDSRQ